MAALVVAGAVPLLLHATLAAIPPALVSSGSDYGVASFGFTEVYPAKVAQALGFVGLTWTGVHLIAVALLGRWWGSAGALVVVTGLIALPSSGIHSPLVILDPTRAITTAHPQLTAGGPWLMRRLTRSVQNR